MKNIVKTGPLSARAERSYEIPAKDLVRAVETAIRSSRRWRLEATSEMDVVHAVRRTRIFKFEDDVKVEISESPDGRGSRAVFESASRVGNSDLGQNRRNLKELLAAVERELHRSP